MRSNSYKRQASIEFQQIAELLTTVQIVDTAELMIHMYKYRKTRYELAEYHFELVYFVDNKLISIWKC